MILHRPTHREYCQQLCGQIRLADPMEAAIRLQDGLQRVHSFAEHDGKEWALWEMRQDRVVAILHGMQH